MMASKSDKECAISVGYSLFNRQFFKLRKLRNGLGQSTGPERDVAEKRWY